MAIDKDIDVHEHMGDQYNNKGRLTRLGNLNHRAYRALNDCNLTRGLQRFPNFAYFIGVDYISHLY